MKLITISILFIVSAATIQPHPLYAQSAEQDEQQIIDVIRTLFDAMSEGDSTEASTLFLEGSNLYRAAIDQNNATDIRVSGSRQFKETIETSEQHLLERFWDPVVKVDAAAAVAWTPYDFHINGEFSHCGVNIFSLVRDGADWKIANITYSVRQNCEESPLGPVEPKK